MKGKIFVVVFSFFLIGLFGACCYLMTIVDPPKLPVTRASTEEPPPPPSYRRDSNIRSGESWQPRENPDYGLEKLPEGVGMEEFRKILIERFSKYNLGNLSYEADVRVVPPIWPSDHTSEKCGEKNKNEDLNTSAPIKAHRRSVDDNKPYDLNEGLESILLNIVDGAGHTKIGIKFISRENVKSKMLRKLSSPDDLKLNVNDGDNNDDDKIIEIKPDDVFCLHVVEDSDIVIDKNLNDTHTDSLLFNSENRSIDSRNLSTQANGSD